MAKLGVSLLLAPSLLLFTLGAGAQYQNNGYGNHQHDNFYNGVRDGGRGGYYDRGHDDGRGYHGDNGYHGDGRYQQPGGIGPGKGALIGGAGGAALGAIFGGGLKGSIIGGAAGAGIGAIAGKAHQNNVRRDNGYYR